MTTIGIDPGKSGGIAVHCGGEVTAHKLADLTERDLWLLLAEHEPATVYLEKVHASPQMGVTSAFTFGHGYGLLRMATIAARLRLVEVTPQAWQKGLGMKAIGGGHGQNDKEKKHRNKAKAQELYPALKIINATADALLILEYGRRQSLTPAP